MQRCIIFQKVGLKSSVDKKLTVFRQ